MPQYQEKATVTRVERFSKENYRLTMDAPQIARSARPGQFVMIAVGIGRDPLLRRPFSLHRVSVKGEIEIYFKVVGRGTAILAAAQEGDEFSVMGPLGNSFRIVAEAPAMIIGGGLGIAPLLFLLAENCRIKDDCSQDLVILGASDKIDLEPILPDFSRFGIRIQTATDNGSLGHHGFVTDVVKSSGISDGYVVYACGPEAMLAEISTLCGAYDISCQVSVESLMACGIGACLACSRSTRNGTYTHVCLYGPVYDAEDLSWKSQD